MPVNDFTAARQSMVESQLRPNRIIDERVIQAMSAVPREVFVPNALRGVAYVDEDIPLGGGRYLMEPMVFARLLQAADLQPSDVVLDIGCGTGYSAAVLCRLAATVVALEQDAELHGRAAQVLAQQACDTVVLVDGALAEGWAEQAPFDVIILEGAVERVPEGLLQQLADGGRLVGVVREDGIGKVTVFRRNGELLARRTLFDAATPLLPGFAVEPGFVF